MRLREQGAAIASNDTKALGAAHLLFRARHEYWLVPNMLLALSDANVTLLLRRMDHVAKQGKRPDGMDGAVYSAPLSIAFPQGRGPDILRPPATQAVPVHPSVQSLFEKPAAPYESLRLRMFVGAETAYLDGMRANSYFRTVDCTWATVLRCRLATGNRRAVRSTFRLLAAKEPSIALAVLTDGLVFTGSEAAVRNVWPLLDPADVTPLLQSEDVHVRERAVAALGSLRKQTP